jgi:hybrid cluster-associated redox disulfide protein
MNLHSRNAQKDACTAQTAEEDKMKITRHTKIKDILDEKPAAHEIIANSGMHCVGCATAASESLEQGASKHGMSDKEIRALVGKINKL